MLSIKPKWCELIASGKKTVEVKKTRPKIETPFKCYIYCTIGGGDLYSVNGRVQKINEIEIDLTKDTVIEQINGKVIGEFVCDKIGTIKYFTNYGYRFNKFDLVVDKHCLSYEELDKYLDGSKGYGWHISDLKIYDKPMELGDFRKPELPTGLRYENDTIKRPFQSWGYVEELK